ncbi:hypothetical protein D0860_06865 [Hortaea werneckii]|uniref:Uncharacterized protein n=1 Tax=Hortaea werneckii TaxID=91943 RepID=A0A3M7IP26_HORWE|nr:hypothetical protein D0860_06865 [Hortaea werneckii]RMZ27086.1 hypothetical protein D0859_08853 [Hortaea werneckii]
MNRTSKYLEAVIPKVNAAAKTDEQLKAFTTTNAIVATATFGIKSAGSQNAIIATITNGGAKIKTGDTKQCLFVLSALPEQWQEFFRQTPAAPYQSYWGIRRQFRRLVEQDTDNATGMFGVNIKQEGIEIQGDQTAFAQWTHVWRRVLELLHDALVGPTPADEEPDVDIDHIVGRYVYITLPVWGKCKVFYEHSGSGQRRIVFLHTAGSDGRQYHGVMNDEPPLKNRQLLWHLYSAQAYGIFHGDLDFYFGGWDGRSRMSSIDTKKCPVYMLTGEYDWSNTPAMSQATCDKIPGAKHQTMQGLGHFPATENPKVFVEYCKSSIAQ